MRHQPGFPGSLFRPPARMPVLDSPAIDEVIPALARAIAEAQEAATRREAPQGRKGGHDAGPEADQP